MGKSIRSREKKQWRTLKREVIKEIIERPQNKRSNEFLKQEDPEAAVQSALGPPTKAWKDHENPYETYEFEIKQKLPKASIDFRQLNSMEKQSELLKMKMEAGVNVFEDDEDAKDSMYVDGKDAETVKNAASVGPRPSTKKTAVKKRKKQRTSVKTKKGGLRFHAV